MRIKSPAKVNLRLEVLSRRPDGYHDIRSIMVPIDMHDVLDITLTGHKEIELTCDRPDLPVDGRNLVHRAARLLLEATGKRRGCRIRISKRIPIGAGLGGGSSNAALTLVGMNRLLGFNLTRDELMDMATRLGADVPFFVLGRPALVTGIGERLEPLAGLPTFWFLLVYPGVRISARWAYEKLNSCLTNPCDHINIPTFSWDISNLALYLKNDLEQPVLKEYPVLQGIKDQLLEGGAQGALMSGSGSTIFGLFLGGQEARKAYDRLKKAFEGKGWEVFLVRSSAY